MIEFFEVAPQAITDALRLLKEVSTRNNAENIKNLKDPQKEGERK